MPFPSMARFRQRFEVNSIGNVAGAVREQLAAAGLKRLGFTHRISACVDENACVPSPGQGIIAIETRGDDQHTRSALAVINDPETDAAL